MSYKEINDNGSIVKTSKDFDCEGCATKIQKGEEAVMRVYKWLGVLNDLRQHPECYSAMCESIDNHDLEHGFIAGEFKKGLTVWESENEEIK